MQVATDRVGEETALAIIAKIQAAENGASPTSSGADHASMANDLPTMVASESTNDHSPVATPNAVNIDATLPGASTSTSQPVEPTQGNGAAGLLNDTIFIFDPKLVVFKRLGERKRLHEEAKRLHEASRR